MGFNLDEPGSVGWGRIEMTGILAIWDGDEVSRETFQRMMEVTAYRGPQGSAVAYMGDVALGQHRIHVTAEDLPETLPLTDGHLTLVADARLDDREALASALSLSINSSDAALLLAAWRKWVGIAQLISPAILPL